MAGGGKMTAIYGKKCGNEGVNPIYRGKEKGERRKAKVRKHE